MSSPGLSRMSSIFSSSFMFLNHPAHVQQIQLNMIIQQWIQNTKNILMQSTTIHSYEIASFTRIVPSVIPIVFRILSSPKLTSPFPHMLLPQHPSYMVSSLKYQYSIMIIMNTLKNILSNLSRKCSLAKNPRAIQMMLNASLMYSLEKGPLISRGIWAISMITASTLCVRFSLYSYQRS